MKYKILFSAFFVSIFQLNAQVTWQKMASLPGTARHHAIGLSHGTKGYVLTGENSSLMKDFYEYNSLTNSWTKLADYPGPARSYGIGYVIGDKAYVGLGHSSSGAETDWWEYDFNASKWTQKTDFPAAGRDHPASAVLNGKIYVGFGDYNGANYKDWWQYDPATDKWTSKTQYPGLAMHHPVTAQDEKLVYLSEGHLKSGSTNKGSNDFYSYDPVADKWTTLTDMPGPGVVAGASFFIGNNKIYSGLGITEPVTSFHKEFYEYDLTSGNWTAVTNYPGNGVFGPVSFVIGSAGYVATGQGSSSSSVQDLYKFSAVVPVPDILTGEEFNLYPNPAVSSFKVEGKTGSEKVRYSMLNVIGEELRSGNIAGDGTGFSGTIDVKDLPGGMYFLKIENNGSTATKKVIVR